MSGSRTKPVVAAPLSQSASQPVNQSRTKPITAPHIQQDLTDARTHHEVKVRVNRNAVLMAVMVFMAWRRGFGV
ncbi:hypothetical protein E2C01_032922 [Portunus trituberculatus]|uniref:Uncharacterized protein n=1 Tax=Portunus trituberculatus TaxID=210409 RepID=A0A5B7F1M4_PORTR|nr:hypothetical protein [Portunus trituberculatus]